MKKILFTILLFLITATPTFAANRFWVGGCSTNKWNCSDVGPVTNWGSVSNTRDNVSVQGTADAVFFDGSAFGNSSSTVSGISINSLDMTGYTNTVTHPGRTTLTITGNGVTAKIQGNYVSQTAGGFGTITFTGTSGTNLFTTAGNAMPAITQNGAGGTTQLQDNLKTYSTLQLTAGTFDTNGKAVVIDALFPTYAGTKVLTMGASSVSLSTSSTSVLNFNVSTGLTITANTATITAAGRGTVALGANNWNGTNFTITVDNRTMSGTSTIGTLGINTAGQNIGSRLNVGDVFTVSNITTNGSAGSLASLMSTATSSAATISKASGLVCLNYMSIKDSTVGGATFYAGLNSTNVSGNIGWIFASCPASQHKFVFNIKGIFRFFANHKFTF